MELEIKHLAPYLPYQLTGITSFLKDTIFVVDTLNSRTLRVVGETKFGNNVPIGCFCKEFKPILRPLSDLNKPIKRDENLTVIPSRAFDLVKDEEGIWCDEFNAYQAESPMAKVDCTQMNFWLFEYHFDVFGLIEKGLAIDINTLSANGS